MYGRFKMWLQGCALTKFLGSPSGSRPCQLGCPALKVGRPPPKKKKKNNNNLLRLQPKGGLRE